MALIAFLHLFVVSLMVGTNVYTSFVAGPIAFKNLPRHIFGNLQSKSFPWYFRTFVVGSALGLYTLRELFSEEIKPIANAEGFLSFDTRNPFLVQIYILFTSLFVSIVNMVWIGPWATRVMFAVHKIEKSEEKAQDKALLSKYRAKFGALHGVSSLLNLIILVCWLAHMWFLSQRITV